MNEIVRLIADVCRRARVEPYLVGGSIRDRLLNVESHDWDFVCPHARKVAAAIARKISRKLIILDEVHRIYRVVLPGEGENRATTLDFAELQGGSIEKDLARRDFTMNAMASPLTADRLIDPYGGQRDLKKRIVRALSRKAFQEDPLRLLRAYRMAAQFDFTIEPRTRAWIHAENARLEDPHGVARERVREELLRLLSQSKASQAINEMDATGLLTTLFPELEAGRRVAVKFYGRGGVITHQLESVKNLEWILERLRGRSEKAEERPSPIAPRLSFLANEKVLLRARGYVDGRVGGWPRAAYLKLAVLLHDIGKPATAQVLRGRLRFFGHEDVGARMVQKLLQGMRFSRQEGLLIRNWVQNHMRPGSLASAPVLTEKAIARFFRDLGEEGIGMLLVSLGDHYTYLQPSLWGKGKDPVERTSQRLLEAYVLRRDAVLPPKLIDGHFLMKKLKLNPGPIVGHLLEAVRDAQAEGKVKSPADALAVAKKVIALKKAAA
jgi:putative nucleotidyltransferase with HDIG domain